MLVIAKDLDNEKVLDKILAPYDCCAQHGLKQTKIKTQDATIETLFIYLSYKERFIEDGKPYETLQEFVSDYHTIVDAIENIDLNRAGNYAVFDGDILVKAIHCFDIYDQWDWWVLGGRWSGSFLCKDNAIEQKMALCAQKPRNYKESPIYKNTVNIKNAVDCVRFDHMDLPATKQRAIAMRTQEWQHAKATFIELNGGTSIPDADINDIRYHVLQDHKELIEIFLKDHLNSCNSTFEQWVKDKQQFNPSYYQAFVRPTASSWSIASSRIYYNIDDWIKAAPVLLPAAILDKNGWHQWNNENNDSWVAAQKNQQQWQDFIDQCLQSIKPDEWLAMVDCHEC